MLVTLPTWHCDICLLFCFCCYTYYRFKLKCQNANANTHITYVLIGQMMVSSVSGGRPHIEMSNPTQFIMPSMKTYLIYSHRVHRTHIHSHQFIFSTQSFSSLLYSLFHLNDFQYSLERPTFVQNGKYVGINHRLPFFVRLVAISILTSFAWVEAASVEK